MESLKELIQNTKCVKEKQRQSGTTRLGVFGVREDEGDMVGRIWGQGRCGLQERKLPEGQILYLFHLFKCLKLSQKRIHTMDALQAGSVQIL